MRAPIASTTAATPRWSCSTASRCSIRAPRDRRVRSDPAPRPRETPGATLRVREAAPGCRVRRRPVVCSSRTTSSVFRTPSLRNFCWRLRTCRCSGADVLGAHVDPPGRRRAVSLFVLQENRGLSSRWSPPPDTAFLVVIAGTPPCERHKAATAGRSTEWTSVSVFRPIIVS